MNPLRKLLLLILCTSVNLSTQAQWKLVWSDEFEGSISSDWNFETGMGSGGWGNNELQYYTSNNAFVENGALVIQARNESYGGASYTSARMKTQGNISWKYGKIEARIAMPRFMGVWPAFWMLGDNISSVGWPQCGEIDIMEHINTENTVYGTVHWYDNAYTYASYGGNTSTDVTGYHIYSVEWNEQSIKWFIDNVQYHEINIENSVNGTEEFHNKFFILLNMAIGGNWPGFTVDNSAFPANMYVDYVRVYQQESSGSWSVTTEAENYSTMSGVETESCSEGGSNVGYIDNGDWMAYNNITIPSSGTYTVEYRVASLNGSGILSLDLNAGSIVLGTVNIPSTGAWQSWTTVSHSVYIDAGTYNVGIYASVGGWNINWFKITQGLKSAKTSIVNEEINVADISLYPSPAMNSLYINGLVYQGNYNVKIYNITGILLMEKTITDDGPIDISNLNSGTYLLQISCTDFAETLRFVKK